MTSKLTAVKKRYGFLKGLHVSMDGIQSASLKLWGYIRRNHISFVEFVTVVKINTSLF